MVNRMIKGYYRFFDDKNSTSLGFLVILALIILGVGMLINTNNANAYQEANSISIMNINGIDYKIID